MSKSAAIGNQIRQPDKFAGLYADDDIAISRAQYESPAALNVQDGKTAGLRKVKMAAVSKVHSLGKPDRKARKEEKIKLEADDDDWNCEVKEDDDWGSYLYSSVASVVFGQKVQKKANKGEHRRKSKKISRDRPLGNLL